MLELFAHLRDVALFVKDRESRFMLWNDAFAELAGAAAPDALLGRTDADFFPRDLAESYVRDDRNVISTGRTLVDRVELIRKADGSIDWYSTTKVPLRDGRGVIVGVAGYTRDLAKMKSAHERFLELAPVLETMMRDFGEPLRIPALAARAGLSTSQLERSFRRRFGTTPHKYLQQIRTDAASQLLAETDLPIGTIAARTGFYDQSHFTRHFVRARGETPTAYRRRTARRGAV